jgi:hypothetical protein
MTRLDHRVRTLKQYGITVAQYAVMYRRQRGACAICRRKHTSARSMDVDHDHTTGRVRGLLCWRCNKYLVTKRHTAQDMIRAAAYLRSTFDGRRLKVAA